VTTTTTVCTTTKTTGRQRPRCVLSVTNGCTLLILSADPDKDAADPDNGRPRRLDIETLGLSAPTNLRLAALSDVLF
jgi:hypothetical protein